MKILVVVLLLSAVEAGGFNSVLDFPGPANNMDYVLLKTNFSSLSAYTVCTWVQDYGDSHRYLVFFSYAAGSKYNNIVLGGYDGNWFIVDNTNFDGKVISDMKAGTKQWYHTCFTWSTSGKVAMFVNGVPDKMQTGMNSDVKVGDGVLVIGQDQDSLGGGFEAHQAFMGQLYNLNVWDRVLGDEEIENIYKGGFCGILSSAVSEGIIVSWDDIVAGEIAGAVSLQDAQCLEPSGSPGRGTVMKFPLEAVASSSGSNFVKFYPRFVDLRAFTACTWIYKSYTTGNRYFFSYGDATATYGILMGDNEDGLGLWVKYGSHTAIVISGRLEPHTWYHTCFAWAAGNESAIYVNGEVAVTEINWGWSNMTEGGLAVIGQKQITAGAESFAGKLYDFNLFSRRLSAGEIARMYHEVHNSLKDDLIMSWHSIVNLPVYGNVVLDAGEDDWIRASPCVVEPECTWEVLADARNIAAGTGIFQGHVDAKKACLGFDGCNGVACNKKDRCSLKTSAEHIHFDRPGYTVYRLTCG